MCPLKDIKKLSRKEIRTPNAYIDTEVRKVVWTKGIKKVTYSIHVFLSRKHKENKHSSNKLYILTC
ncbi:60S ribosomal protein L31 [Lemmus lemmus]